MNASHSHSSKILRETIKPNETPLEINLIHNADYFLKTSVYITYYVIPCNSSESALFTRYFISDRTKQTPKKNSIFPPNQQGGEKIYTKN